MAPMQPTLVFKAATNAGMSNLWSWVSTQMASPGPNRSSTLAKRRCGQSATNFVRLGEADRSSEHGPSIAHRDVVTEHFGDASQRGGKVDRPEDQHAGGGANTSMNTVTSVRPSFSMGTSTGVPRCDRRQALLGIAGDDDVEVGFAQ